MCLFLNSHILYLERGWGGDRWGAPYNWPIPGGAALKCTSFRINHSFFFFNFWHGQAKETTGKNGLKWVKLPSFESDLLKTNELRYSSSKSGNFTDVCLTVGARHKLALPPPTRPVKTSVKFCNFTELYPLTLRRITFKFGNVTASKIKIKVKIHWIKLNATWKWQKTFC